jgi:2-hydroxy-6-oxonona-2,4-dienedioate hydrolase
MVPFEVSIAILNHIADSRLVLPNNCGHWPPFEKPAEWAAQYSRSCRATERGG